MAGDIIVGDRVRAACRRHLADLERDDLYYDRAAALQPLQFFEEILQLSVGKFHGKPFVANAWQAFVVGSLFGWRMRRPDTPKSAPKQDWYRRFHKSYIEIGKGSGKTPLAAAVALYVIVTTKLNDDEPVEEEEAEEQPAGGAAEGYVIARNADQALVAFTAAARMVQMSEELVDDFKVFGGSRPDKLIYDPTHKNRYDANVLRRVSSDSMGKGKSGFIPYFVVVDEYHEHDSRAMLDFFEAGTKQHPDPMILVITNAGAGMDSPCGQEHMYATRVAMGDAEDDRYFAYVCGMDKGDEPFEDESCWPKANPSLPVVPDIEYLRKEAKKAVGMPGAKAHIERLNFCRWTDAESPWLEREAWEAVETSELPEWIQGAPCYLGMDLSLKDDLTAVAQVWVEPGSKDLAARVNIWVPGDLTAKEAQDNVPYPTWKEMGYIDHVDYRKTIDYDVVARWLARFCAKHNVKGCAYDHWKIDLLEAAMDNNGYQVSRLRGGGGLFLMPHHQGFVGGAMQRSAKEQDTKLWMPRSIDYTEEAIIEKRIEVLMNPCLRWAAMGTIVITDGALNRKLNKKKALTKTDPMVALTMAVGYARAEEGREIDVDRLIPGGFYE